MNFISERSSTQSENRSKLHSTAHHLIKNGAFVRRKDECVRSAYSVIFGAALYKIIMQSIMGCWEVQWVQVFTNPMHDLKLYHHSLTAAPSDCRKVERPPALSEGQTSLSLSLCF